MEDNAIWSEMYKSDRFLLSPFEDKQRNDRFYTYKYQNAPDEAGELPRTQGMRKPRNSR